MKRMLLLLCPLFLIAKTAISQKKTLDKEAIDKWPYLQDIDGKCGLISSNGRYVVYKYGSLFNGSAIVLKDLSTGAEKKFMKPMNPSFSENSNFFFTILSGDTLLIRDLEKNANLIRTGINSYKVHVRNGGTRLAYLMNDQSSTLMVENLANGKTKKYYHVDQYEYNKKGDYLLLKSVHDLELIQLSSNKQTVIPGSDNVITFCTSENGEKIAFITKDKDGARLKCYSINNNRTIELVKDSVTNRNERIDITSDDIIFSKNGNSIYFKINYSTKEQASKKNVVTSDVNVWSYKDTYLQELQEEMVRGSGGAQAVFNLESDKLLILEKEGIELPFPIVISPNNRYALVTSKVNGAEFYWNKEMRSLYLISLNDGGRITLARAPFPAFSDVTMSANEQFIVWFDAIIHQYMCYDIGSDKTYNLTNGIYENLSSNNQRGIAAKSAHTHGIYDHVLWLNEHSVVITSQYDLWLIDVTKKKAPINLTNGYGKKNEIRFRIVKNDGNYIRLSGNKLLISAFDEASKKNGFWEIKKDRRSDPSKLIMDDHAYYFNPNSVGNVGKVGNPSNIGIEKFEIVKSTNKNTYLCQKMSANEAPNVYITKDFRNLDKVSNINPQKEYNWIFTRLIQWQLPDGTQTQGILHIPDNVDSTKKYPVIFTFYERHSEYLNVFRYPDISAGPINIPWYSNRGYLIFEPDFYYVQGKTARTVIETVESAANKLASIKFVDTSRMGIMGHSHGGYEANIIATGTCMFKAVCAMAGYSNIISEYGSIRPGGYNNQRAADLDQRNLGVFPWEHPEVFIENSPIFNIGKMCSPLLLVHNKGDKSVSFSQALEMYLNMRRAGKKVWLLEYDKEGHGIRKETNRIDYNLRMNQFFDHYLKDKPAPVWMTQGIQYKFKGIQSGLELDTIIRP